mmetsp:Transcript_2904/g.4735  ORF Transcript_2904/g.4735 Transcript_2904/m.4735 type:complete len:230 (-) Transcript_2904:259-948(-)
MAVMSSTIWLMLSHRRRALTANSSAASRGSQPWGFLLTTPCTICTAWLRSVTSQMPSLPSSRNRSSPSSRCSVSSGSAETPSACTMPSPRLRDMARPMVSPRTWYQMRMGPMGSRTGPFGPLPTTSCRQPTLPPAWRMRWRSSGRSGLWSFVSGCGSVTPFTRRPSTAFESPRLPTVSRRPSTTQITQVAPEHFTSIAVLFSSSACIARHVRLRSFPVSRYSWGSRSRH